MISLSITALFVVLVIALCFTQTTLAKQHAAYVYGFGCASHFLIFEYMNLNEVVYHWSLYYIVAAFMSSLVITALQNLPTYTKFHQRLQWIALSSIAVNGVGVLVQELSLDIMIYQLLSFALYLALIWELSRNGRHFDISKDTGLFSHLRWPAI